MHALRLVIALNTQSLSFGFGILLRLFLGAIGLALFVFASLEFCLPLSALSLFLGALPSLSRTDAFAFQIEGRSIVTR
jgi:hypothetical protein